MRQRKIIHVDMDCFYASVEEKYNPSLKGKPVAVGGPANSRAVICTANYEARKYKVKAAVPSSRAVRLCPQLILVPPNFALYKAESRKVRAIFERFTDKIEPLSLDEAYLDVTESAHFEGSATRIARAIRGQILDELKLTASAGIAENKFLAKIASDWHKPNGQFVIHPRLVESFMPSLPVEKIWGVGRVTAERMRQLGFFTCGDLQKLKLERLRQYFGGSRAHELYQLCRGIDEREVCTHRERKSLTVEETFQEDLPTLESVQRAVPELYLDWLRRMDNAGCEKQIRGLVVKLKFTDFKSMTHERAMREFPSENDFRALIASAWQKRPEPIRLLGLGVRLRDEETAQDSPQLGLLDLAGGGSERARPQAHGRKF